MSETLNLMQQLPCLSIRQPWATSILHGKDVENRDWRTSFRGRFLIHAGKEMKGEDVEAWQIFVSAHIADEGIAWAKEMKLRDLPRGGIVGMATLVDCVVKSSSPWFCGTYGFVLADVAALPFMPCRGALGFFRAKTCF